MSIIRWRNKRKEGDIERVTPDRALGAFRSEMDRLFDRFFADAGSPWEDFFGSTGQWMPAFDVSESDKEITVRAEVPGVDPREIDVSVSGRTLTIAGEKKECTEDRGQSSYRCERRFGRFQRSIELPTSVDPSKVNAEYKNGVLTIHLARDEKAAPKKIAVKPASS